MSTESSTTAPSLTWLPTVRVSLFSYGHANGPIVPQDNQSWYHKLLAFNIRHLPNPPRHLRASSTGLSRRLQKEFLQNDDVEPTLVKVQSDLRNAVQTGYDQLLLSTAKSKYETGESNDRPNKNLDHRQEDDLKDPNINVVVTICCEEGRHRSVAFVEELARRLALFKHGDSLSRRWQLSVEVTHRDIGNINESEQPLTQQKRPNKAQAKSRQKERRDKVDRYRESGC